MKLVGAHVLGNQLGRRAAEEGDEGLRRIDGDALGGRQRVVQAPVLDHAPPQWGELLGHGELPSSGLQDRQS